MTGHIFINGEIGDTTTPISVRNQISPEYSNYEIHINSFGGDVYDGYQIGNMILNLGKPTMAIVEGMCASIATYIACCADKITMIPEGSWTIHDPTAQTGGRAEDLLKAAAQLNDIKARIVSRYMTKVARKGITPQQLSDAMAKETTYDSDQAEKWGFVDDVREKLRAVAKIDLKKFKMETLSKEETIGLFEKFGQKVDALITSISKKEPKADPKPKAVVKPKNIDLTLTDGTIIQVDAQDPNNLKGAAVVKQDGSPLEDGTYETAEGMEIDVAGGVVMDAEQEPVNEDEPINDMETIQALKAQVAEMAKKLEAMPGAQPVTKNPAAKVKPEFKDKPEEQAKYDAKILELEKQIAEMKKLTVGSSNPPKPAAISEEVEPTEEEAAFVDHVVGFYEGRGFLKRVS